MMKVLEEGLNVCLSCGEGLEGALIDFEAERNETEPECDYCASGIAEIHNHERESE
jgi:transcription initiation factor TFIIIB Brf1 subunit/transcription initiation factor TFIIB